MSHQVRSSPKADEDRKVKLLQFLAGCSPDPHVLETMIAFEQALYGTRSLAENGEQRAN
jgi:hypothetical protein